MKQGEQMMHLAEQLWPIGRSLSGQGVRDTLRILSGKLPNLATKSFPSGEQVSDWTIPKEWNVKQAYIIDPHGKKICDYAENNLNLMGYSIPVDKEFSLEELQPHLFSLADQPTAIPYVTSYYKENWGFCLPHNERLNLKDGIYKILIESSLESGRLDYAELFIQGKSKREVLFSTYICHPSMANNELSGPVLATELAKALTEKNPYYSYRFLFIPETVGSIAYVSKNLKALQENLLAGFVLTCVGDDRTFSYVPSRKGDTVADKVALEVIKKQGLNCKFYSWKDRGSDERQFSAPGVDLPVCSVIAVFAK
jgi:aminopeptidase-like protein